jgi:hypothetical protein
VCEREQATYLAAKKHREMGFSILDDERHCTTINPAASNNNRTHSRGSPWREKQKEREKEKEKEKERKKERKRKREKERKREREKERALAAQQNNEGK